ncbi:MAG: protein-disulfide reductase DsbD family protein [Chlorobium sp.]|nr:protein-disulfide reductase DsbD family protein [Chlorobium sp.]MCW8815786.1 protein-disulfide reductase DsbD family protein [Chlorobium sp.]
MPLQRFTLLLSCIAICLLAWSSPLHAGLFGDDQPVEVEAFLVGNSSGEGLLAAVHLKIEEGWHVYWKNPGEAGMPVEIVWKLPEGFRSLPVEYPFPERFESGGITGFGYRDEVVLFSRIVPEKPSDNRIFPRSGFPLKAEVSWLSCKEVCIPGSVSLDLEADSSSQANKDLAAKFLGRIPLQGDASLVVERIAAVREGGSGFLEIDFSGSDARNVKDFFPLYPEKGIDIKGITVQGRSVQLPLSAEEAPERLKGVVVTEHSAYVVDAGVDSGEAVPASSAVSGSLPVMLGLAFLGGILLNVMPCVLPVIGLKVFSLVGSDPLASGGHSRKTGRVHSLVFAAGVLLSFWVLAAFVWGLQGMGQQIGWGFQFQSPVFVMFIAAIVFAFSLNLFGLFELGAPVVSGKIGSVALHHDVLGSFVSGVLATTLATPCTAPFLGTALGFAFVQPVWVVFLFFTVIAVGMAAPYVILAWHPAWLKLLPKPGHWMFVFKQLMGFILVAVVVWLAAILNAQAGSDGMFSLLLLLFVVAFCLWVVGSLTAHGASLRKQLVVWAAALVFMTGAFLILISDIGSGAKQGPEADRSGLSAAGDNNGALWQEFSPLLFEELLEKKKTVFLEFTADWCITCKVLEASVLGNNDVVEALHRPDVAAVRADWTSRDDAVTALMQRFGRSGVPLFVLIPHGELDRAVVLPEVVTVDMLLRELERARE